MIGSLCISLVRHNGFATALVSESYIRNEKCFPSAPPAVSSSGYPLHS